MAGSSSLANLLAFTPLSFGVRSNLKKEIEAIAEREGQSAARICEAFLLAGSEAYKKQGRKFLEGMIGRLGVKRSAEWFP
jgi:hypothetical protein